MTFDDLRQVLLKVASHVFEKSAFMGVLPGEEIDLPEGLPKLVASISFSGPQNGRLILAVSPEILLPLVTSMLGTDGTEEIREESKKDALLEVLNMVCGNVLIDIFGNEPVFRLQPPMMVGTEEAEAALAAVPENHHITIAVENTRADLIFQWENKKVGEAVS